MFSAGLSELRTNLRREEEAPKIVVAAISRYLYPLSEDYVERNARVRQTVPSQSTGKIRPIGD